MTLIVLTLVVAPAVAVVALAIAAPAVAAPRINVRSTAQFRAAVARLRTSGGTIVLVRHRYGALHVGARGRSRLVIRGRGSSTGDLELRGTRAVTVYNIAITPSTGPAYLRVTDSHRITLTRIRARGTTTLAGAISVISSGRVTVEDSNLSRCGDLRKGTQGFCLRLRDSDRITVRDNRFHDCFGCDFIHGRRDRQLLVTRNTFRRALVGPCGRHVAHCNHQDLIQLSSGAGEWITRNLFGVYDFGAAQVYLTDHVDGVLIQNNVFLGTDPKAPGIMARDAIKLGNQRTTNQPVGAIVNENTILAGAVRSDGVDNSVILSTPYTKLPPSQRPVIVNNVIARTNSPSRLCRLGTITTNVVEQGDPCNGDNTLGDPALDALGRPTAGSTLVINRALAEYAVAIDYTGRRRDQAPDIGAYEYVTP